MGRFILSLFFFIILVSSNWACDLNQFNKAIDSGLRMDLGCIPDWSAEIRELENTSDFLAEVFNQIKKNRVDQKITDNHYVILMQICEKVEHQNHIIAQIKYRQALRQYIIDNYDLAIDLFEGAILYWRESEFLDSVQVGKSFLNIGVCHFYNNNMQSADQYLKKTMNEKWPISVRHQVKNLRMLGLVNREKGNFQLAEQYLNFAGNRHMNALGDSLFLATQIYRALGSLNFKFENLDQAEYYFNKSITILNNRVLNDLKIKRQLRSEINNLALTFFEQKQYQKAIDQYGSLLRNNINDMTPEEMTRTKLNIAAAYINQGNLSKAAFLIDEMETFISDGFPQNLIQSYMISKGLLLSKQGKFDQAIEQQKKVLSACCQLDLDRLGVSPVPQIPGVYFDDVYGVLSRLAVTFREQYRNSGHEEDLVKALEYYRVVAEIMDQFKADQFDPKFSVDLGTYNHNLAEEVLELHKDKSEWAAELYDFVEKAKSASLLASIHGADADDYFYKRYPIIQQVSDIKKALLDVEKQLADQNISGDEKIKWQSRQLELNEILIETNKQKFDILKNEESLNELYRNINLEEVQNILQENTTMLSYFVARESPNLYVFLIDKQNVEIVKKKLERSDINRIKEFVEGTSKNRIDDEKWIELNNQVSDILLADVLEKTKESIIIIPDGILSYLPFEMLLTKTSKTSTSFHRLPYLIKEKTISYNFSASIWEEMMKKNSSGRGLLTMAPSFSLDDAMVNSSAIAAVPLAHAQKEVKSIGGIWKSKYEPENKQDFIEDVSRAKITHFAGHAFMNDEVADNSYLAFSSRDDNNDKLFIREIYNMRTPNDLVVLSACNTGQGELKKGEGVMSMARAFAYAGAKSLVYSLWDVNDRSTRKIMEGFYAELKRGATIDEALRTAKLAYLDKAVGQTQHPYYWAGFVAMGDVSMIDHSSNSLYWFLGAGCLLLFALFFGRRHMRQGIK